MVGSNLAEVRVFESVNELQTESLKELNWCSVSLSEVIDRGLRLEATLFDVEGKKAREIIENCSAPKKKLAGAEGIAEAYTRSRFKRIWVEKSDYPIYQPSSILELYPKPDGYIAQTTQTDIDSLRVKKDQILLTCSGTIGKVAYVSRTLDGKIFSHDLLRITCDDRVDAGYLYAFIKSEIGNKLITTNQYGAVVSHIEASHLEDIEIPYPNQSIRVMIASLVHESHDLRDKANDLWDAATDKLYKSLELQPFHNFKERAIDAKLNSFSVKLSELDGRVDGSYHNILVPKILNKIADRSVKIIPLGDSTLTESIFLPSRFKRVYVSEGHGTKMFGIKQITTLDPFTDKYLALGSISDGLKKELLLKPDTILISRSGTIGNMCIVPKHWENWIASEDLIRIIPTKGVEGYIYCFLSSEYGQELVKRFAFGSVQDHIDCDQVSKIPIPLLKDERAQEEINELVIQCNKLRAEAYSLEKDAMNMIKKQVFDA